MKILLLLITLFLSTNVFSQHTGEIAKVIIIKGKAHSKSAVGKVNELKKGEWLKEGSVVKTAKKSFVKLLFIDKSTLNLGPESQIKIEIFEKESAGVVDLIRGSIRSKVSKDYMDIKNKDQSKLIIKTKTAAMGVRGTDFTVIYDQEKELTTLQVWEGKVQFMALTEEIAKNISQEINTNFIDKQLNKSGISVTEGLENKAGLKENKNLENTPIDPEKMNNYQEEAKSLEEQKNTKVVRDITLPIDINDREHSEKIKEREELKISGEKVRPEFRPLPPSASEIAEIKEKIRENPEMAQKMEKLSDKEVQEMIVQKIQNQELREIPMIQKDGMHPGMPPIDRAQMEQHREMIQEVRHQQMIHKNAMDDQRRLNDIQIMEKPPEIPPGPLPPPPPPTGY